MKDETKRKIHKWLCIILFSIMFITSFWTSYLTITNGNETIITALRVCGYLAETPFLLGLVIYLFKYRRYKKEQNQ